MRYSYLGIITIDNTEDWAVAPEDWVVAPAPGEKG